MRRPHTFLIEESLMKKIKEFAAKKDMKQYEILEKALEKYLQGEK